MSISSLALLYSSEKFRDENDLFFHFAPLLGAKKRAIPFIVWRAVPAQPQHSLGLAKGAAFRGGRSCGQGREGQPQVVAGRHPLNFRPGLIMAKHGLLVDLDLSGGLNDLARVKRLFKEPRG